MDFGEIFSRATSPEVTRCYWTAFGSLFIYVTSRARNPVKSHPVISKLIPGRSDLFYHWIDFVLNLVFGVALGHAIFDPQTTAQALTAGMTWPAAAAAITKGDKDA